MYVNAVHYVAMDTLEGIHQFLLAFLSIVALCMCCACLLLASGFYVYIMHVYTHVLFLGEILGYIPLNMLVKTCLFFWF